MTAKKTAKKKAVKKTAKRKDPDKSKAALAKKKNDAKKKAAKGDYGQGNSVNSYCRELLLEKKFTDEEIHKKVRSKFPKKNFAFALIYKKRWILNSELTKDHIEQLVKVEGKLIPKPKSPKKSKAAKKKYTKENDPLVKHAGINVHDKEKKVKPRKLKKPAKKSIS